MKNQEKFEMGKNILHAPNLGTVLIVEFEKLKDSKTEDKNLHEWINRAFDDIEENAFCAIQVPKNLFPKEYVQKYQITNLWKYDLPNGWRLLYTVGRDGIIVLSIILEWLDHKNYERRFGY